MGMFNKIEFCKTMLKERKEVLAILKGRTDLIDSLKERYIKTTEGEIIMWKKKIKKESNKEL